MFYLFSFLRDLPLGDLGRFDRIWMWLSAIEMFKDHVLQALIRFPVGHALPARIPDEVMWFGNPSKPIGVSQGYFPSVSIPFFLRFSITWGLLARFLLLFISFLVSIRIRYSLFLRCISALIILEGLTMGLFYLSNVRVPLFRAIGLGFSETKKFREQFLGIQSINMGYSRS